MKKPLFFLLLITCFFTVSCSSYFDYEEAQIAYYEGNYEKAYSYLQQNSDLIENKQGSIINNLDHGIVAHALKEYEFSTNSLLKADKAIEDNFSKSVTATIGSYFINETVRDYVSPFYEDIYTNIFLSLNFYHTNNIESAMVEVRRSLDKLQLREVTLPKLKAELEKQLIENDVEDIDQKLKSFDSSFHSSALSYYLSSLFAFEYGDFDTSRISREKAVATYKVLPNYYEKESYETFKTLEKLGKDKALINFLAFSGLAPIKVTKVDTNVLVLPEYTDENGVYHPPYFTNVVYSVPKNRGSVVREIEVIINGNTQKLEPFENLELIAYETINQISIGEYTRAYIRAISREIAKSVADTSSIQENDTTAQSSLFSSLFTIFSFVSEGSGDLRVSHFFPSMSWIGSFEVDPGKYDIVVNYLDSNKRVVHQEKINNYNVKKDKANLIEVLSAK